MKEHACFAARGAPMRIPDFARAACGYRRGAATVPLIAWDPVEREAGRGTERLFSDRSVIWKSREPRAKRAAPLPLGVRSSEPTSVAACDWAADYGTGGRLRRLRDGASVVLSSKTGHLCDDSQAALAGFGTPLLPLVFLVPWCLCDGKTPGYSSVLQRRAVHTERSTRKPPLRLRPCRAMWKARN